MSHLFTPPGLPVPRNSIRNNVDNKYIQSLNTGNQVVESIRANIGIETDKLLSGYIFCNYLNGMIPHLHANRHTFIGEDPLDPALTSDITEISDYLSSAGTNDTRIPRADHIHAHGRRSGGDLHATATQMSPGFMSTADKIKLDNVILSNNIPIELGLGHPGMSQEYARSDHQHPHGNQSGGLLHKPVTSISNGFMCAADKIKLDQIIASDLSPLDLGLGHSGMSQEYSRADHQHRHGNQSGGSLHECVTSKTNGFMSATDKTKLDNMIPSDQDPLELYFACPGVSQEYARADHQHPHGFQIGGKLHDVVSTTTEGFMTPADKIKLNNIPSGSDSEIQYNNKGKMSSSPTFTYDTDTDTLRATNANFTNLPTMPLKCARIIIGSEEDIASYVDVTGDATIDEHGILELEHINKEPGTSVLSTIITNEKGLVVHNETPSLQSSHIWVGSSDHVPTPVHVHGDATISNAGALALSTVNVQPGYTFMSNILTNSKGQVVSNKSATLSEGKIWLGDQNGQPIETGDLKVDTLSLTNQPYGIVYGKTESQIIHKDTILNEYWKIPDQPFNGISWNANYGHFTILTSGLYSINVNMTCGPNFGLSKNGESIIKVNNGCISMIIPLVEKDTICILMYEECEISLGVFSIYKLG